MSNNRVTVQIGFTKNVGNFNSIRYDIGLEADVKPGVSFEEAEEAAYSRLEAKLVQRLAEIEREVEEVEKGAKSGK